MDPHLRAVRVWDKDYMPNEKEAYHLARIEGYIFPQLGEEGHIGSLYEEELEAIASHPPNVDLRTYRRYKRMSLDQLRKEFPEVVHVVGDMGRRATEEDLFYWATRGWIPEYDSLNYKLERYRTYQDLSGVGKSLMDMIYGDHKGYVDHLGHPLDKYIVAFDRYMDDESTVRAIGERIGISIPEEYPAHEVFYEKLANHIESNEPYGYQRPRRQNSSTTGQLIDMTEKEFYDAIREKGHKPDLSEDKYYPNYLYSDRLRFSRMI